jgi:hypothetical protein
MTGWIDTDYTGGGNDTIQTSNTSPLAQMLVQESNSEQQTHHTSELLSCHKTLYVLQHHFANTLCGLMPRVCPKCPEALPANNSAQKQAYFTMVAKHCMTQMARLRKG